MVVETFERVAEAVTQRTAELLSARVVVIDERGVVITNSDPRAVGVPYEFLNGAEGADVRVPIRLNGQTGQVVVSTPPDGEAISPRLARALIDLVISQTAVVAHLPSQHELKNKFIHDLLRGPIGDETDILREGQILGMDFSRPRAVMLIDAADYILDWGRSGRAETSETLVRRRAQAVIDGVVNFFNLPNATICAYIGDGEVAVLKASTTQDLVPWIDQGGHEVVSASWANLAALKRAGAALLARLRHDTRASISVGIGRYHPGLRGLARSYQDARAALSLGRRSHGQNQVHCLDGLGVAAFVGISDERTKVDLAMHLLSPLDQEPELLETLSTFFSEDCCPSSTAARLSIHRNTLGYRLDKISSLSGLDPRRFDDAVQIRLALLLRSFRDNSS